MARPTKYKRKYCKMLLDFFNIAPYSVKVETITTKSGATVEKEVLISNDLPTLAGFAKKIGVHRDSLHQWSKDYKEFSDSIKRAKEMQENILVTNGLKGLYAAPFAIFTAKNILGWRDKLDITKRTPLEAMVEQEAIEEHGEATPTTLSDIVNKYGKELKVLDRVK